MKKMMNPKWMKLLKVFHLLGMALLCIGLLGTSLVLLQQEPDEQLLAWLQTGFMSSGGIFVMATGLIYNIFTRYGFKRRWILGKWVVTVLLFAVSFLLPPSFGVVALQLGLLFVIILLSVYKW
mgnify:CR=1 FL=1